MADTIFALATASGRAGIAVVRISGPQSHEAAAALAGTLPAARAAGLRTLRTPRSGEVIDTALVLRFMAPESFTGEDAVELQVHGSPAVLRLLLAVLGQRPGLRQAAPGEFTRRALENGRLDLGQVEGLGDLLEAETAAQHRQATRMLNGALTQLAGTWRDRLVEALAAVEVVIDFADEDLPEAPEAVLATLEPVIAEMTAEIAGSRAAERLRDGFEVALVGPPNVGKSTLLNALARRDVALVSAVAGTTRDVLEVRLDLEGLPVTMLDMAGLHQAEDAVEVLGIARARQRAEAADMRVFLLDDLQDVSGLGVSAAREDVTVLSKADLRAGAAPAVSGLTGEGLDGLLRDIASVLSKRVSSGTTACRERHRAAIEAARTALTAAAGQLRGEAADVELAAVELRNALNLLDILVGRVDVDSVLDVVFRNFCLGK